jgi:hypothetical protein
MYWSQQSQGKRRHCLKVSFGSLGHGGEWPVLSFTADSNGHEKLIHDWLVCGSQKAQLF